MTEIAIQGYWLANVWVPPTILTVGVSLSFLTTPQSGTEIDRQTDRYTDRQIDTQTDTQT